MFWSFRNTRVMLGNQLLAALHQRNEYRAGFFLLVADPTAALSGSLCAPEHNRASSQAPNCAQSDRGIVKVVSKGPSAALILARQKFQLVFAGRQE